MIEEDFYATIKLKTGEEIFARVIPTDENNHTILLINHPIIISQFKLKTGEEGYKIEPWLKTTTEDLFVLNLNDVITMTETTDIEIIHLHQQFIKEIKPFPKNKGSNSSKNVSRRMGYISSVEDAKRLLEHLYKNK